ncbi:hypothetical protein Tco_0410620, partial [Tanacetum coccineum]
MRGICFNLPDDAAHCSIDVPIVRKVIYNSQFTAKPRLLDSKLGIIDGFPQNWHINTATSGIVKEIKADAPHLLLGQTTEASLNPTTREPLIWF